MSGFPAIRSLQDIERIEETPLGARLSTRDVYRTLTETAGRFGKRTAILDLPEGGQGKPRRWNYNQALAAITRTANLLHEAGQGAPVGYLLPNLAETHFVLWGAAAGAGAAPVNPLLSAHAIADILDAVGARAVVVDGADPALAEKIREVRARLGRPLAVIAVRGVPQGEDWIDYAADMQTRPGDRLAFDLARDTGRIAAYFHTGGTTGSPKVAQQTHANQTAMAWMLRCALDLSEKDVVFTGLPLFHATAAILTGLAPLAAGATLVLGGPSGFRDKALLDRFWSLVQTHGVTVFSGVPTIYASLLDRPVGEADVSSLRYGVVGAAPMPVSVFTRFEAATGIKILELYGMTESTCVSTCNPRDGERRVGSIGLRMPYHQIKVAILDETGAYARDARPGEVGVLALKGETVIPGYRQAEKSRDLFLPGGWLNSGDLARFDADGYVWLTGRAKDLIIRGGHNIDPGMIENALSRHEAVELAAAVGQPDAYAGEIPVAYVVLREGAEVSEADLMAFAKTEVDERPAVPKAIRIIAEMPVTAVGKIFKPALREDAAVHAAREALDGAGLTGLEVTARTEKQRGLVVRVSGVTDENERAVAGALADFAFAWERT